MICITQFIIICISEWLNQEQKFRKTTEKKIIQVTYFQNKKRGYEKQNNDSNTVKNTTKNKKKEIRNTAGNTEMQKKNYVQKIIQ